MKLRVLGCSGGELPRHKTTCFLLDGRVALDAGALTSSLSLEELLRVDDVVLSHSHFDHVKDVPLLADLLVGRRTTPVRVHASTECARTLRDSVFNDRLWPDFTRIPSPARPVLELRPFAPTRPFKAGTLTFRPVPVCHPVESVGFVVSDGRSELAISGDTGPTVAFWKKVNATRKLRALLVEVSFPNDLQGLADVSGHLTPNTLATELAKLDRNGFPVLLYHLKPAYAAALRREVAALKLPGVRILAVGDQFTL
ncbi:MAG: 3',5'-cyclic-nucleotide phosphodiesterase [Anaeromyxobacter sp.]|nr:3',5'-cyclic-nucleotide phosphodiesterase [Anaeromyxobacter sp.]MBL0276068.1 3',5'-cyclic-nucleotide phosphodiesterase [Anaeromyxobacter sp.]